MLIKQPLTGVLGPKLGSSKGNGPMDTGRTRTNFLERLWCSASTSWRGADRDLHSRSTAFRTQRAGVGIHVGKSGGQKDGEWDAFTGSRGGTLHRREKKGESVEGLCTCAYILIGKGSAQGLLNVRDTSGPAHDVAPGDGYIIAELGVDTVDEAVDKLGLGVGMPLGTVMDLLVFSHEAGDHEAGGIETAVFRSGGWMRRKIPGERTAKHWSAEVRAVFCAV